MRSVRTKRWKYIRRHLDREHPLTANCDPGPAKTAMLEAGWRDQVVRPEQLFDLSFDPNEAANLASEARYEEVLVQMRDRLDRWMNRTNDPLLRGPVPAPPQAVVNRPDDVHPKDVFD
jgi:hypothetical protein